MARQHQVEQHKPGLLAADDLREIARLAGHQRGVTSPGQRVAHGAQRARVVVHNEDAGRFEMLAWENPFARDGPASPFWHQDGMPEGLLEPGARPLVALVGDDGSVEGLRLLGGDLVLKIEYGGAAVQSRLNGVGRFPQDGGIGVKHTFGLRVPLSVRRLLDFWSVAGRPAPRNGKGRGAGFMRLRGW